MPRRVRGAYAVSIWERWTCALVKERATYLCLEAEYKVSRQEERIAWFIFGRWRRWAFELWYCREQGLEALTSHPGSQSDSEASSD